VAEPKLVEKKFIILLVTVFLLIAAIAVWFTLKKAYTLSGQVVDITNKQPVADVIISSPGKETKTDKKGSYELEKLNKDAEIKVGSPEQFEALDNIKINFRPFSLFLGQNQKIELVPTAVEMERRITESGKAGNYNLSWEFMYPDDQEYWGKKEDYISYLKKRDEIADKYNYSISYYKIVGISRMMKTWQSEITGKEYNDVSEITKEITYSNGKIDSYQAHWVKMNGIWRYFTRINNI